MDFLNHPLRFFQGYERKGWDFNRLPVHLIDFGLENLERISSSTLGVNGPMDEFQSKTPPIFILVHEGNEYLVNTEGYNYCRYACRIAKQ